MGEDPEMLRSNLRDLASGVVMSNDERSWMVGTQEQQIPYPAEVVALCDALEAVEKERDDWHRTCTSAEAAFGRIVRAVSHARYSRPDLYLIVMDAITRGPDA